MSTTVSGDTGVDKATNQAVKDAMGVTGTAPIFGCRAWVNFDGTRNEADTGASVIGQNVKIRASGNVSSVVKNGVGDYTVNFTTAMEDADFAAFATCKPVDTGAAISMGTLGYYGVATNPMTTTSVRIASQSASSGVADTAYMCFSIFR